MNVVRTVFFRGFQLVDCSLDDLLEWVSIRNGTIINTINPHSFVIQKERPEFKAALIRSDFLLPDGIGICLAYWLIYGKLLRKISGFDLFYDSMKWADKNGFRVMFVGSSPETLDLIKQKAKVDFPNVIFSGFSPPYKSEFSKFDLQRIVEKIDENNPDVLFFGLTAPKQEILIHELSERLNAKLVAGIGAVFNFYAGNVKRPNEIWIKLGLEWFIRLLSEPKRLWRRTIISVPKFLVYVFLERK